MLLKDSKTILIRIVLILGVLTHSLSSVAQSTSSTHGSNNRPEESQTLFEQKIRVYQETLLRQKDIFLSELDQVNDLSEFDRNYVAKSADDFFSTLIPQFSEFIEAYSRMLTGAESASSIADREYNLRIASDYGMQALHKILLDLDAGNRINEITMLHVLTDMTHEMRTQGAVESRPKLDLNNISVLNRTFLEMCRGLLGCIPFTSFDFLMRNFDLSNFLHHDEDRIIYNLSNDLTQQSDGPEVHVLSLNHEYPLVDTIVGHRVAKLLGADESIFVLGAGAWPQYSVLNRKSNDVVLTGEGVNVLQEMSDKVDQALARGKKKIFVVINPQGQFPSFAAQMPLVAKAGAFVFARKISNRLKGQARVYLKTGYTNFIEHISRRGEERAVVNMNRALLVPDSKVSRGDSWIEEQRLKFETNANRKLGLSGIDLIDREEESGHPNYNYLNSYEIRRVRCEQSFVLL